MSSSQETSIHRVSASQKDSNIDANSENDIFEHQIHEDRSTLLEKVKNESSVVSEVIREDISGEERKSTVQAQDANENNMIVDIKETSE